MSDDDLLLYNGLVYVPNSDPIKLSLLIQAHNSPTPGHFGQHKVFELLSRNFTWPGMRTYINDYVGTCDTCQGVKSPHHNYRGLLQSLLTPTCSWGSLSWDHITDLPQSFGYDSIIILVDSFTKSSHFVPAKKTDTARDLASQFIERVFAQHGRQTGSSRIGELRSPRRCGRRCWTSYTLSPSSLLLSIPSQMVRPRGRNNN